MSYTSKIPPLKYPTSNLPTYLEVGTLVLDSDTKKNKVFNDSSWDVVSGESLGTVTIVSSNSSTYDQIEGDIPDNWKQVDTSLKGLVIGTSCTSIGSNAFYFCTNLSNSLVIPDSVTSIGSRAFYQCDNLTGSLVIPDSVTSIGDYAFSNCSGFNGSLTIGNSVTSIGTYAFRNCIMIAGPLIIPDSVTSIGTQAFSYLMSLGAVYTNTPASSFTGSNAFGGTGFTTIYTGPNATGYTSSFQGRTGLTISPWTNYPTIP